VLMQWRPRRDGSGEVSPSSMDGVEGWTSHRRRRLQWRLVCGPTADTVVSGVQPTVSTNVTPRVSNPHDYINHMFKRP
jgi:hypothetical protein